MTKGIELAAEQGARVTGIHVSPARAQGCDLIVMASHGHRGIKGFLLGSETHRVLTHSDIPTLIWR